MLKNFLLSFLLSKTQQQLVQYYWSGYLSDMGWIKSYESKLSVNIKGKEIPWWSYSSIQFLEPRIKKDFKVLEFGSGNSSIFFAQKVDKIISIESKKDWYENLKSKKIPNLTLYYHPTEKVPETDEKFDIIIIDGKFRKEATGVAPQFLKPKGVIIFDDTERAVFLEPYKSLSQQFKKIDFWGLSPGIFYDKCTTIFYRDKNCLSI